MNDNILDDFDEHLYLGEGDDHEVVAKYFSPLEGDIAAARLRSEGIPCFLANTTSQSLMPHLQLVARLHVRPKDFERAREILGEAAIDAGAPDNSGPVKWSTAIIIVVAAMLGMYLAMLFVQQL
jgi:carbamoylphosphate synthase large subunit